MLQGVSKHRKRCGCGEERARRSSPGSLICSGLASAWSPCSAAKGWVLGALLQRTTQKGAEALVQPRLGSCTDPKRAASPGHNRAPFCPRVCIRYCVLILNTTVALLNIQIAGTGTCKNISLADWSPGAGLYFTRKRHLNTMWNVEGRRACHSLSEAENRGMGRCQTSNSRRQMAALGVEAAVATDGRSFRGLHISHVPER